MLGEKIQESTGKVTGQRFLRGGDYRYLEMEITIREAGTLFGQEVTNLGTYTAFERVPGQLYGDGQGLVATADGQSAIWNGHGVGRMTGEGMAMGFRYSLAFQAASDGALSRLNGVLVVGEHEVDANGNTRTVSWEWK